MTDHKAVDSNFEEWAKSHGYPVGKLDDRYFHFITLASEEIWQAALASRAATDTAQCTCPQHGTWLAADDYYRNVKALDEALNGKAAERPLFIDVLAQVQGIVRQHGKPLLELIPATDTAMVMDAKVEALAKKMYIRMTDNDPVVHSNRFARWEELDASQQFEWIAKARTALSPKPASSGEKS